MTDKQAPESRGTEDELRQKIIAAEYALSNAMDACDDLRALLATQRSTEPAVRGDAEALRDALLDLDARLRRCFGGPITAEEAYDSYYQEMVAAALAQTPEGKDET